MLRKYKKIICATVIIIIVFALYTVNKIAFFHDPEFERLVRENKANYEVVSIDEYKRINPIEGILWKDDLKDVDNIYINFRKVCDIFLDKNLQTNRLLVTYFTKEDFDKFEEYRMDYIFNQQKYYYRISSFYSKVDKVGFDEVKILEGDEKYGK